MYKSRTPDVREARRRRRDEEGVQLRKERRDERVFKKRNLDPKRQVGGTR